MNRCSVESVLLGLAVVTGSLAPLLLGAFAALMLPVTWAVDVDVDGAARKPIEDGDGKGWIPEVLAPRTELDIRSDGGGNARVPLVEQVVEHVRGGGFVLALLDLAKAHVVNDE